MSAQLAVLHLECYVEACQAVPAGALSALMEPNVRLRSCLQKPKAHLLRLYQPGLRLRCCGQTLASTCSRVV